MGTAFPQFPAPPGGLFPAPSIGPDSRSVDVFESAFRRFVEDERFPCLAGKGVVRSGEYRLGVYGALGSGSPDLARDLGRFSEEYSAAATSFSAFVAVFPDAPPDDESEFERRLWAELQKLHERDAPDAAWDPTVSSDPDDPRFSFSFGERAYFVVGLHPESSRLARRFEWPALVFNPHAQFDRLRAAGLFDRLRQAIRGRDMALQGSLNPNLTDFGERSEARQYSGRKAETRWKCPFHRKTR